MSSARLFSKRSLWALALSGALGLGAGSAFADRYDNPRGGPGALPDRPLWNHPAPPYAWGRPHYRPSPPAHGAWRNWGPRVDCGRDGRGACEYRHPGWRHDGHHNPRALPERRPYR